MVRWRRNGILQVETSKQQHTICIRIVYYLQLHTTHLVCMNPVCEFCDGTWLMESVGAVLSFGDSGLELVRRLKYKQTKEAIKFTWDTCRLTMTWFGTHFLVSKVEVHSALVIQLHRYIQLRCNLIVFILIYINAILCTSEKFGRASHRCWNDFENVNKRRYCFAWFYQVDFSDIQFFLLQHKMSQVQNIVLPIY